MNKQIQQIAIGLLFFLIACEQKDKPKETPAPAPATETGIIIEPTKDGTIDTVKKSLKAFVTKKIGPASFTISYYSPAVRNRIIWGGLVPYEQVWVTGAHNATTIQSTHDFMVDGKTIPAGKYALFTIPGKDNWIFILNKNFRQHLADDYDPAEDIARIQIKADTATSSQERLMYDILQRSEQDGHIEIRWEKLKLVIPVTIPQGH